jgi:hypothetical protein
MGLAGVAGRFRIGNTKDGARRRPRWRLERGRAQITGMWAPDWISS